MALTRRSLLADPGEGQANGTVFTTKLTGAAVLVTAQIGPTRLIARTERGFDAATGTRTSLRDDTRRLHLFDAATGLRQQPAAPLAPALVPGGPLIPSPAYWNGR